MSGSTTRLRAGGVSPRDWAEHTPFSDPGPHAPVLAGVAPQPEAVHAAVTGLVAHYRGEAAVLDPARVSEVDLRWCERILDVGLARSPQLAGRSSDLRGGGCCRDHTLLAVAVLRQHGVPARSRVGFAAYFVPNFHVDHVVVEQWDGERWVLWDAELPEGFGAAPFAGEPFDVRDIRTGVHGPFVTAAQAWLAHRRDGLDLSRFGVAPGIDIGGRDFVRAYVRLEAAHRRGDELLLWDVWGPGAETAGPEDPVGPPDEADRLADEVADLLVRADAGDAGAEWALAARYADDDRLHPGDAVRIWSPLGRVGTADLAARTTTWD